MSFKGSSKPIARPSASFSSSKGGKPKTAATLSTPAGLGSLVRDDMAMEPSRDPFDAGPKLKDVVDASLNEILRTFSVLAVPGLGRDLWLLNYLRDQAAKFSSSDSSKRLSFYMALEGKREDLFRLCTTLVLEEISSESLEAAWAHRTRVVQ